MLRLRRRRGVGAIVELRALTPDPLVVLAARHGRGIDRVDSVWRGRRPRGPVGVRRLGEVFVRLRVGLGWMLHTSRCMQNTYLESIQRPGWQPITQPMPGIRVAQARRMGNLRPKVATAVVSAKAAGLRYATCDKPGITRQRRGKGFIFKGPNGQVIRDERTLARIRALVLPPAWTGVWISSDPRAHLQATGHDAAGRKQYRYHADWTTERNSTKYHRMLAFAEVLPTIRKRTRRDLMGPACCRPRVPATVVEVTSEERCAGRESRPGALQHQTG